MHAVARQESDADGRAPRPPAGRAPPAGRPLHGQTAAAGPRPPGAPPFAPRCSALSPSLLSSRTRACRSPPQTRSLPRRPPAAGTAGAHKLARAAGSQPMFPPAQGASLPPAQAASASKGPFGRPECGSSRGSGIARPLTARRLPASTAHGRCSVGRPAGRLSRRGGRSNANARLGNERCGTHLLYKVPQHILLVDGLAHVRPRLLRTGSNAKQ